jgi:hypothetical protein
MMDMESAAIGDLTADAINFSLAIEHEIAMMQWNGENM